MIEEPYTLLAALGITAALWLGTINLIAWFGTYKGGTR